MVHITIRHQKHFYNIFSTEFKKPKVTNVKVREIPLNKIVFNFHNYRFNHVWTTNEKTKLFFTDMMPDFNACNLSIQSTEVWILSPTCKEKSIQFWCLVFLYEMNKVQQDVNAVLQTFLQHALWLHFNTIYITCLHLRDSEKHWRTEDNINWQSAYYD